MSPIANFSGNVLTIAGEGCWQRVEVKEIERNWNALSHRPDRRAAIELRGLAERLNDFDAYVEGLRSQGGPVDGELARFVERHLSLTRAYWAAEGRCMSWFITGASNFPVARNEKRFRISVARWESLSKHIESARKAAKRRAFPYGAPGEAIRGDNPDAPELLRERIAELEREHAAQKAVNAAIRAAIRAAKTNDDEALAHAVRDVTGWPMKLCAEIVKPDFAGNRGFAPWTATNRLANIKRLRARLASIEEKRDRGTATRSVETAAGAVEVVENADADRIQLVFPGKPGADVRQILKSHGFRWSPREGAWQRHLNNAGRDAASSVLREIGAP